METILYILFSLWFSLLCMHECWKNKIFQPWALLGIITGLIGSGLCIIHPDTLQNALGLSFLITAVVAFWYSIHYEQSS